jgi:septum formation protein
VEPRLVLASSSPRRARILGELGVSFRVVAPNADESLLPGEDGAVAVERLARQKALAVARGETLPVLAADTEVVCDGRVLGKPGGAAESIAMLRGLAGRGHEVVTGLCLVSGGSARSGVERTSVRFAPMSQAELAWYATDHGRSLRLAWVTDIESSGQDSGKGSTKMRSVSSSIFRA